jgi:hypothetical protein
VFLFSGYTRLTTREIQHRISASRSSRICDLSLRAAAILGNRELSRNSSANLPVVCSRPRVEFGRTSRANPRCRMSAFGYERTSGPVVVLSALPPKADLSVEMSVFEPLTSAFAQEADIHRTIPNIFLNATFLDPGEESPFPQRRGRNHGSAPMLRRRFAPRSSGRHQSLRPDTGPCSRSAYGPAIAGLHGDCPSACK